MTENEVVFRDMNKRALDYIDELNDIADGDKATEFLRFDDALLHFYCECADENCHERIPIKPSQYNKIHENNSHFVILPEHQVGGLEKVVKKLVDYYVVEKYLEPPEAANRLHETDIDNTNR
jgi:hypothetical protein